MGEEEKWVAAHQWVVGDLKKSFEIQSAGQSLSLLLLLLFLLFLLLLLQRLLHHKLPGEVTRHKASRDLPFTPHFHPLLTDGCSFWQFIFSCYCPIAHFALDAVEPESIPSHPIHLGCFWDALKILPALWPLLRWMQCCHVTAPVHPTHLVLGHFRDSFGIRQSFGCWNRLIRLLLRDRCSNGILPDNSDWLMNNWSHCWWY